MRLTNLVASGDLHQSLDLERLCIAVRDRAEYEPEQFPGLVYTLSKGKALVFATGKIVITGVTSWEEAETAVAGLRTDLHPF